jgi:hypothetical protein
MPSIGSHLTRLMDRSICGEGAVVRSQNLVATQTAGQPRWRISETRPCPRLAKVPSVRTLCLVAQPHMFRVQEIASSSTRRCNILLTAIKCRKMGTNDGMASGSQLPWPVRNPLSGGSDSKRLSPRNELADFAGSGSPPG